MPSPETAAIPPGFVPVPLDAGFISHNGPIYVRNGDDLVFGFLVEPHMCNIAGVCHGGWIATALDMVMPLTARLRATLEDRFMLTVNLSVDFLGSPRQGDWVEGRGQVLRKANRLVFTQGLLTLNGEPIARGSSVLKIAGETAPLDIPRWP